MATDLVTYSRDQDVAIVTMDDGKANALSYEMLEQLLAALTRAEAEARAIVLAGRPERFSGGFDLRVMMAGPDAAVKLLTTGAAMLMRFYGSPIPVVIACTGHAVAAGALLALTGDYRVGAYGAFKLGLNEVAIGLPVPVLAMELARDRLTAAELPRATLSAQMYDPEAAVRAGYLDAAVPADQLLAHATTEAARLGKLAPAPYRATKHRLRARTIAHIHQTLDADLRELMPIR